MVAPVSAISFALNDEEVQLTNVSPHLTLLEWLRAQPGLTGTKKMCGEGGCGCCVVSVTRKDPRTGKPNTIAINSCLCPLHSVNGWDIKTVEGIGSSKKGFHRIQKAVAQYNGTQCGYCTPGFVMSMYSLLDENPDPTEEEVEGNFDGNICRCTGYRSILDAMKSLLTDSENPEVLDIEDIGKKKKKCPKSCNNYKRMKASCCPVSPRLPSDPMWYRPQKLSNVFDIFQKSRDLTVKLVCGDTGRGVFKSTQTFDVYVDIQNVVELTQISAMKRYFAIGAAVSLSGLIQALLDNSQRSPTFKYLAEHLQKIASVPIRNIGSWAGNLMLTHDNNNFPSDVFTIMAAVGATVTIATLTETGEYPLWDFLNRDMTNAVLITINIPYSSSNTWFRSFKIMPRSQNAHAYVNAAFCMEVNPDTNVVQSIPSFVFGGIDEHAVSATATESFVLGRDITNPKTLQGALEALSDEIEPNSPPVATSMQYRKNLAMSLFYKFYLAVLGDKVDPRYLSAATPYIRPLSKGSQSYQTIQSEYPLTQAMPKLTANLQTSGEAQYTTDIASQAGELAAAFVITTMANAKITSIDETEAMKIPGAIEFITAKNIPENGQNNCQYLIGYDPEPLFATDTSFYAGQPVAMVIADTQTHADEIAKAVNVSYKSLGKPVLTIKDAIAAKSFFNISGENPVKIGDAEDAISKSDHQISGEISCGTQYHFHMETHTAIAIPEDSGYTVYSSSQWLQQVQFAVAGVLGIPNNKVNVSVKRVGGGFGGKISRAAQTAAACALGANVTGRPVRMHMDLETNMKSMGKRFPHYAKYTVGSTKSGMLTGIKMDLYNDSGYSPNENSLLETMFSIDSVYKCANWLLNPKTCKTHTACNTYCRGPGFTPAIFIIESAIDHLARSLKIDPEEIKEMNMYKQGETSYIADPPKGMPLQYCNIRDLWKSINETADVSTRKDTIAKFNSTNRWRKRGLSMVPLRYGVNWVPFNATVMVSVYSGDGTVSIVHGGVEIGQGINTKIAQVAAHTLGIGLNLIEIKPTNTLTNPNGMMTGSSITSELNCQAVLKACESLKQRLDDVKTELEKEGNKDPTWLQIVTKAYMTGVDLSSKSFLNTTAQYNFNYNIYGVTCAEVEIDVLTGQTEVLRVDILYDCGESMNPEIDVGQVEGAFMMGLGYWLTEKVVYDNDSGQLLTHNTWEYKPPASKDIPQDFRVALLQNAPNPLGVLRSKAVGEPPLTMSNAVLFAVKRAIEAARSDSGNTDIILLSAPATVENIQMMCDTDISQFVFN